MPMGHAFPRTPQPIRPKTKLRFLLIYSDPKENLPGARQEVGIIEKSLNDKWHDYIEVETIQRKDASGRKLNEILRKGSFDVIHYAGHAYFDRNDADLSGLLLHDDEHFLAQKIRRLTEGRPLVFLNACESAQTANEKKLDPEHLYLQKPAEGLASAFIYGGALGCIGSLWSIYDAPAAYFAVSFYNYVLMGHMIGEAMRLARREIKEKYPNQITWAAFVLYGDPTFRL
ncbi:MAG TPA: CHAT domain-containing protein, partial [Pyrinomonadaceae bacterium]|jgi:CHAT domain-containing protein